MAWRIPRSFSQQYRGQVTAKHAWLNEVEKGWPCCPGIVWEPIRQTSSHATRQGTLGHGRLSLLSHCGLILVLRLEMVCQSQSPLRKEKEKSSGGEWIVKPSPIVLASEEKAIIIIIFIITIIVPCGFNACWKKMTISLSWVLCESVCKSVS